MDASIQQINGIQCLHWKFQKSKSFNQKHFNKSLRIKLREIFNCNSKSDIFLFMLIKTEDWAQMINEIVKNLKIVMSVFFAIYLFGGFVIFWDGLSDMFYYIQKA